MPQDLEKLVVSLSADIKSYERGLAKATGVTTTQLRKIEGATTQSLGRVEKSFAKAGNALAGFGKGLAVGALIGAVAGLEQLVTNAVTSAAAIGDLSDKIGITSGKLQELQFGAVQANMSFEEMETSLLKFSKALGQARNGQGDLLKTLEANGFDKAKIKALSYSEALDVVADLVKNAATEQDALLIITQAFGKGGDEMLEFLRNGSAGLRAFADEAKNAGAVISDDLIKSAQAFDDAWAAALLSVKAKIGDLVLSAVPLIQQFDQMVSDAADNLGVFLGTLDPKVLLPLTPGNTAGKGDLGTVGTKKASPTKIFDPQVAAAKLTADTKAQAAALKLVNAELDFQNARLEEIRDTQTAINDSFKELGTQLFDAFDAIATGGEKADEVIKNLAVSLLKAATAAAIFGTGPFASLFGTAKTGGLFAGLFGQPKLYAAGGTIGPGKWGITGEAGPELIKGPGTVIPFNKMGGGGGNIKMTVINQTPARVETQRDSSGNPLVFIRQAVAETISGGFADSALRNRHGILPQKARR